MQRELRLCHMYPDLLNLYGDRGNILALQRRAQWRDITVSIAAVSLNDTFDSDSYDLIFLGGGQDVEQNILRNDFVNVKGSAVKEAVEKEKIFLCICGGYQMMGEYYQEHDGNRISCLGALQIWTMGEKERLIGDTAYQSTLWEGEKGRLFGFENHSGRTFLKEGVKPLAKVLKGAGNNGMDGTEGAIYKNVFCTYSHGSFLPKNPQMTDYLLEKAMKKRYGEEYILPELDCETENIARKTCPSFM